MKKRVKFICVYCCDKQMVLVEPYKDSFGVNCVFDWCPYCINPGNKIKRTIIEKVVK